MKPFFTSGFCRTYGDVIPPGNVDRVVFKGEEVLSRRPPSVPPPDSLWAFCLVHGHGLAVFLGKVTDFLVSRIRPK